MKIRTPLSLLVVAAMLALPTAALARGPRRHGRPAPAPAPVEDVIGACSQRMSYVGPGTVQECISLTRQVEPGRQVATLDSCMSAFSYVGPGLVLDCLRNAAGAAVSAQAPMPEIILTCSQQLSYVGPGTVQECIAAASRVAPGQAVATVTGCRSAFSYVGPGSVLQCIRGWAQ